MTQPEQYALSVRPSRRCARNLAALLPVLLAMFGPPSDANAQPRLKTYQTRYYTLHTDLDEAGVQEATLRITLMAEEYNRRTQGLAGSVNQRLPFYLFKNREDYYAAGGMPGSDGVYMGVGLMAITDPTKDPTYAWQVIQHEGFHQFVHATMGNGIPIWANEGMAEYFAEGIWTGDQFIVGLIPEARRRRIRDKIASQGYISLYEMMHMSHEAWVSVLTGDNYDLAWSMVHFLAHGDDGRYEQAFMSYLRDVAHRMPSDRAWKKSFGNDVAAFQQRWEAYWLGLPERPTGELYTQTVVSTITSFYARAISQRQTFDTPEAFFEAAGRGELQAHKDDWLPPTLLERALINAPRAGTWAFEKQPGKRPPLLSCTLYDDTVLLGQFKYGNKRVKSVCVESKPPGKKKPKRK